MFTLEDIFKQVFPFLEGISFDVGTVIVAMLLISFIVIGFDYVRDILESFLLGRQADAFSSSASTALSARNSFSKGSQEYDKADMMYRGYLNKSASADIARGADPSSTSVEFGSEYSSSLEMESSSSGSSPHYEPDYDYYESDHNDLGMESSSSSSGSHYEPDYDYYDPHYNDLDVERQSRSKLYVSS
ncbi:MAG: hypothetical protein OCC45_13325 [Desulfotalea sp.]